MNGGNYHVSVTQIMETEKKLKLLSLLKLNSSKCGQFNLKEISVQFTDYVEPVIECQFEEQVLESTLSVSVTDEVIKVLIFISDYVAKSVSTSIKCCLCMKYIMLDNVLDVDLGKSSNYSYLAEISRGGLKWPTEFLVTLSKVVFKIFQTLISEAYEENVLTFKNHKSLLMYLSQCKLADMCCNLYEKCSCGVPLLELFQKCINVLCNIFINNYCKVRSERIVSGKIKSKAAKRKLLTLKK